MLDEFLKNELSFNRESGTYLFYGDDLEKNYNIALEFSAELFSKNIENEIEKNKIIDKTLRNLYSDLMVVDTLNIDTVLCRAALPEWRSLSARCARRLRLALARPAGRRPQRRRI